MPTPPATGNDSAAAAPSPDMDLEHPIIFFDGVCGLCNRTVDFVISRDHARRFRFAPLQGETAQRLLGITPDQQLSSMALIDRDGIHHQTDAVWRMLCGLSGFWSVAGRLLRLIPRPLRNCGYNLIARNRYQWFGRKESCRLPAPAERGLFLP